MFQHPLHIFNGSLTNPRISLYLNNSANIQCINPLLVHECGNEDWTRIPTPPVKISNHDTKSHPGIDVTESKYLD